MGALTALYKIDIQLFNEIRKRRRLRRMVDVLQGQESPQTLDLDADLVFPVCHLDRAWHDFAPLLRGINKSLIVQGFRGWSHIIKHRQYRAFYWEPVEVIWCLSNVWFAVEDMDRRIRAYATRPDLRPGDYGNIVHQKDLVLAFDALEARIEKRWQREEAWLNSDGEPFVRGQVDEVFGYLCRVVRFMTDSVCNCAAADGVPAGEVIVGVSG